MTLTFNSRGALVSYGHDPHTTKNTKTQNQKSVGSKISSIQFNVQFNV